MILVNNPGSWAHVYSPLDHAPWHGWTPTDLIFPFFLFIVGAVIPFSFRKYEGKNKAKLYRRVLRRSAVIYMLGLFLSLFPNFDLSRARFVGVLPRIAIVYLITSVLVINLSRRGLDLGDGRLALRLLGVDDLDTGAGPRLRCTHTGGQPCCLDRQPVGAWPDVSRDLGIRKASSAPCRRWRPPCSVS